MKKKLTQNLTLFYTANFPKKFNASSSKKYTVTIGIGGNIGNTKKLFDKLILCLKQDSRFTLLMTSPLLRNPPFGFLEQNDFLNGIIRLKTNLCPNSFLKIFFDDKKINTKDLIIPHKNWASRESVIIPLKRMK